MFKLVLITIIIGSIGLFCESLDDQTVCIYNNRTETISIKDLDTVTLLTAGKVTCNGAKIKFGSVVPIGGSLFGGRLTIKDFSGAILFDLTGSEIDDAFTNISDNYYRLDVN